MIFIVSTLIGLFIISNIHSVLAQTPRILQVFQGGTSADTLTNGLLLFGQGMARVGTSTSLFWDNTNLRLGVGSGTPGTLFSVQGPSLLTDLTVGNFKATSTALLFTGYNCTGTNGGALTVGSDGILICSDDDGGAGGGVSLSGGTGSLVFGLSSSVIHGSSSPAVGYIVATTSTASILPYASSTSISLSNLLNVNGAGTSTFAGALTVGTNGGLAVTSGAPANTLYVSSGGNVGIGTAAPGAKLHIFATTEQLRLGNTASEYASFTVDTFGGLAIDPAANQAVSIGAACGNCADNSLYAPFIRTDGSSSNKTVFSMTSGGARYGTIQVESTGGMGAWSLGYQVSPTATVGTPVLTWNGSGNVGVATATPGALLSVHNGSVDVGGVLTVEQNLKTGYLTATSSTASFFNFASSTSFSTSDGLSVGGRFEGANLTDCVGATFLQWNGTTRLFGCATPSGSGNLSGNLGINMPLYAVTATTLSATSSPTATSFNATSTLQYSSFPLLNFNYASGTALSLSNLLNVNGAGTSTFAGMIDITGNAKISGNLNVIGAVNLPSGSIAAQALSNTAVSAGSYGSSGATVPTFTVDAQGRLTVASSYSISGLTTSNLSASAAITNGQLANSTIGATSPNSTLTFGSAASLGSTFTGDLNLATANSWTGRQTFINASSTSFSLSNLLNVNGAGTSTFSGSLTAGALAVGTSSPSSLYGFNVSGRGLWSGQGTSTIDGGGTALGGLRVKGNLLVDGIEILGGCKGCPAGGGSGTVTSVDGSGGTTGLTLTGGPITDSGTLTLGGTLAIANGGTNATSFTTSGNVVYYNGTSLLTAPLTSAITIPFASSTSVSLSNLLNVNGAGTSTFSGSLTAGALAIGTSSPSALYGTNLSGRFLAGGEGTSTINGGGTANGGLRIKGNLLVDGIEILGGCKGCPVGGGAGTPGGASGDVQFNDGGGGFGGEAALDYNSTTNLLAMDFASTTSVSISNLLNVSGAGTSTIAGGLTIATSNGNFGVGTSSPQALFGVGGSALIGAGSNDRLTINTGTIYQPISSTTTVPNLVYAWSVATSSTGVPVFSVNGRDWELEIPGNLDFTASSTKNSGVLRVKNNRFLHNFGIDNTFLGLSSGNFTTTGSSNVGIGSNALSNLTTGSNNIAIGFQSLFSNTLGLQNVAIGRKTLYANTTGGSNIAIGDLSLNANSIGQANIAIGSGSLALNTIGTTNIAMGEDVLGSNGTGSNNIAIGFDTLFDLTSGNNNLAIGDNTARGIVSGSNNTIIGAGVIALSSGLSNNIILADGSGNQRVNIASDGYFGIGTATPGALLSVHNGSADIGGILTVENNIKTGYLQATSSIASFLNYASSTAISLSNLLNVNGIGTSTFSGSLLAGIGAGAFGIGTSSPGDFTASIAGRMLFGAENATSTNVGSQLVKGNLEVRGNLVVNGAQSRNMMMHAGDTTGSTASIYCGFFLETSCNASETAVDDTESPMNWTATGIYASVETGPAAGKSWNAMLRVNGANTALLCTIANPDTSCTATSTVSVSVAQGDNITILWTQNAAPASSAAFNAFIWGTADSW